MIINTHKYKVFNLALINTRSNGKYLVGCSSAIHGSIKGCSHILAKVNGTQVRRLHTGKKIIQIKALYSAGVNVGKSKVYIRMAQFKIIV